MIGWAVAGFVQRIARELRPAVTFAVLAALVVGYAAAWFYFNLGRMPPYIPGATMDPTYASPEATKSLAVVTAALILPGSAIACVVAFRRRARMLTGRPASRASA